VSGRLLVVGVGPGDPELMTLKAARIIAAAPVVAFFAKRGSPGNARMIAGALVRAEAEELRLDYPFTTELPREDAAYRAAIDRFYDEAASTLAARLETAQDVVLLCEGDPFFYGSSMHIFARLAGMHRCAVVPGVSAMSGCWSRAHLPLARGETVLAVLPGTLAAAALAARFAGDDAAVVMKVGRNLKKIRAVLAAAGRLDGAVYVERGTMTGERILPLAAAAEPAPYFSLVLVPARGRA
jgi:precorrin-2/cobalt-factor-2 C20-methyltransferase